MRRVLLLALITACSSTPPAPSGPAVVKVIAEPSERIEGVEAQGRVGDFLLDNGRVRFVVQAPGSASGWGIYGGSIVDLDRAGPGGDDRLQEIFFQCNLRGFAPTSVAVHNDGRDGKPGVLRMRGVDRGIPLLDSIVPSAPAGLDITIDLILPQDRDTLEIAYDVADTAREELRDVSCGMVLLHGDEYAFFLPGSGPVLGSADLDWIANSAPSARASYVIFRKTGAMGVIAAFDEVVPIQSPAQGVFPGGRYRDSVFIALGKGDVATALEEMGKTRLEAAAYRRVEVPVVAPAARLPHVTVTLRDSALPEGGDHESLAHVDPATGRASFLAREGGSRVVDVRIDGRLIATRPVSASIEPVTIDDEGELKLSAVELDKLGTELGPTPAHLFVLTRGGALVSKRYVRASDATVLPAGDYTIVLSKGPEHELHREDVTVPAGGEVSVSARLRRVVDTEGWLTVDTHVHSTKSVDADEPLEQRVLGAVGEGLDVLLSTDHDVVTDYAPTAARLGLSDRLKTELGTEISPLYGHFNAWPLTEGKYWDVAWFLYEREQYVRMLDPHEIVALARSKGASIVQVNHPRGGKGALDYIEYDPMTNMSAKPFPEANCIELMNGKGGGAVDAILADLMARWRNGHRVTATAVSDAHGRFSEIGYGRTAIYTGDEGADLPTIWRALADGKAVAMIGAFVTLTARAGQDTARIGDTLNARRGPVTLELLVQAPSWMDVDEVEIMRDGAVIFARTLGEADRDPNDPAVRFRGTVTATPSVDAFFLARARGDDTNEPVMGARVKTVTNPIFVDVQGDGFSWGR